MVDKVSLTMRRFRLMSGFMVLKIGRNPECKYWSVLNWLGEVFCLKVLIIKKASLKREAFTVVPLGLEPRLFGTKNRRVASYTIGQFPNVPLTTVCVCFADECKVKYFFCFCKRFAWKNMDFRKLFLEETWIRLITSIFWRDIFLIYLSILH